MGKWYASQSLLFWRGMMAFMNIMLKEEPFCQLRLSFLWEYRGGWASEIRVYHCKCTESIRRAGGKKNEDAATYLMECCTESPWIHPFLWELSKSVDGDKCLQWPTIYLVDKRINCCYLPQTQTGLGAELLWLFFCAGGGFLEEAGPLGKLGLINGRSVPSPGSEGVRPAGRLLSGITLSALMCPVTGTHTQPRYGRGNIFCEPF